MNPSPLAEVWAWLWGEVGSGALAGFVVWNSCVLEAQVWEAAAWEAGAWEAAQWASREQVLGTPEAGALAAQWWGLELRQGLGLELGLGPRLGPRLGLGLRSGLGWGMGLQLEEI